jgi:hypothetical protein
MELFLLTAMNMRGNGDGLFEFDCRKMGNKSETFFFLCVTIMQPKTITGLHASDYDKDT